MRWILHSAIFLFLTALTLVGGLAWLPAVWTRSKALGFPLIYGCLWLLTVWTAPLAGREPLPCFGETLRMQSPFYCVTLRHFVDQEMAQVATRAAGAVKAQYPDTVTLALDGGFAFTGLPLLPHLSHDDGEKLDFAFYYTDQQGDYLSGKTRSPLGYFAFESLDAENCPAAWPTLRWDFRWAQGLFPERLLEPDRTRALIVALEGDARVRKIFVEPPLAQRLGVSGDKIRFQGCRAARHDDHIHVQL